MTHARTRTPTGTPTGIPTKRPAMASRAFRIVGGLGAVYGSLCLYAWLFYPKLLYPAPRPPAHAIPLPARCEALELGRGPATVRALRWAAKAGRPTIAWFHGNGELVEGRVALGEHFASRGFGFVLMEYRGYGRSASATPSEAGLYADADALLRYLRAENPSAPLVAVGYSLGSGVVSEMATRKLADRFVLVAPFTSITDIASRFAPLLPARLILTERFETLAKARRIEAPLLVIHGAQDEVVPFDMGYAVANAGKNARLVTVRQGHHADVLDVEGGMGMLEIERFAAATLP